MTRAATMRKPQPGTVYAWRPNSRRHNLDPQEVGEALEAMGNRWPVSPEEILQAAEPEDSPLHPAFEWDDTVAAHHWRVAEARHLVHDLRVTLVTPDGEVRENARAFVNVIIGDRQGYVTNVRVASDRDLMRQALAAALDDLNAWRRRYSHLQALAGVFAAVDALGPDLAALVEVEPEPTG